MRTIDPVAAARAFIAKMQARGLVPPKELLADGKFHRVDVDARHGKADGSYLYFSDGIPAGAFINWRDGGGFESWSSVDEKDLSPLEYAERQKRLAEIRKVRDAETEQRWSEARDLADRTWDQSSPCPGYEHPYLTRKGVKSHGLRVVQDRLVIPLRNADGEIQTLEFIDQSGRKMYLTGGRKAGHWFSIGKPAGVICVVEGYATGASVHEATGYAVAVACDCGNLQPVAEAMRAKFPTAKIVLCADDDASTENNPGVTSATKAARAVGGVVVVPTFGATRPDNATDFNDLAAFSGLPAVKACIDAAIASDGGPIKALDLFPLVFQELQDRKEGNTKDTLHTGIAAVDRFTGGLRRGYLTVIAGLPGQGKTSAASGMLTHNAARGVPAFLISLEMDRMDIGIRCMSVESRVPAVDLFDEHRPMSVAEWGRVGNARDRLMGLALTIDDRPLNINQIVDESCRWYASEVKGKGAETGLIAIDYLGLIRSEDNTENRNREVAALVQRVKLLARSLRIPILLLAQLNRKAAGRGGDPHLSDLRDSGEIEAAADLVIFPWPAPRDETGQKICLDDVDKWIIGKNKNGRKGAVKVQWLAEFMQYADPSNQSEI